MPIKGISILTENQPNSMNKIEWWLLKYSDFYKKITDSETNQHLTKIKNGSTLSLPTFKEPTDQEKFLDLYKALDTISEFYRNEKYFENELIEYHKINNSKADLKKLVAKNKNLVTKNYTCFLIDYLDYSENTEHLNIFVHSSKELNIYINCQDFKNTIEFLEIFNQLYYQ